MTVRRSQRIAEFARRTIAACLAAKHANAIFAYLAQITLSRRIAFARCLFAFAVRPALLTRAASSAYPSAAVGATLFARAIGRAAFNAFAFGVAGLIGSASSATPSAAVASALFTRAIGRTFINALTGGGAYFALSAGAISRAGIAIFSVCGLAIAVSATLSAIAGAI